MSKIVNVGDVKFKPINRRQGRYMTFVRQVLDAKPNQGIEIPIVDGVTPNQMRSRLLMALANARKATKRREAIDVSALDVRITEDNKVFLVHR